MRSASPPASGDSGADGASSRPDYPPLAPVSPASRRGAKRSGTSPPLRPGGLPRGPTPGQEHPENRDPPDPGAPDPREPRSTSRFPTGAYRETRDPRGPAPRLVRVTLSDPGPGRKAPGPQTARADEPHSRTDRVAQGPFFLAGRLDAPWRARHRDAVRGAPGRRALHRRRQPLQAPRPARTHGAGTGRNDPPRIEPTHA